MFEIGTFSVGSLLGLAMGTFLGHSLAIRRGKSLARHNAAVEFRKVVFATLSRLEAGESQFDVIQTAYDEHCKQAISYSAHLKGRTLQSFRQSLNRYKHWRETMYGRSHAEILYDTDDPEYLEAKSTSPRDLLEQLIANART